MLGYPENESLMESRVLGNNKKIYQNLAGETFIHFTTLPRAKEIKESRHLLTIPKLLYSGTIIEKFFIKLQILPHIEN